MCLIENGLRAQNLVSYSRFNIIVGWGGGGGRVTERSSKQIESLQFDNKLDIHMSSKNYEENDYSINLDLPIISY